MKKISFVFDKSKKSQYLKRIFLKKYRNFPLNKSDLIVVGGGDGFMLKTIKNLYKFKKPFYGINCGSVGFLLNRYTTKKISEKINRSKISTIYPLQVQTIDKKRKKNSFLAVNELSLFRQSKQTSLLQLKVNKKILINNFYKDHRIFMTSVIAALCFGGEWTIEDAESHMSSFPSFLRILREIGCKF